MQFKVNDTILGDYGLVHAGAIITIHDKDKKKIERLISKGLIQEHNPERPKVDRKAYTVYENKAVRPESNKVKK